MMKTTKESILDLGKNLLQSHGYNGFSYKDIANQLGIKTSSIHYYFPAKEDLAVELIQDYKKALEESLEKIDQQNLPAYSALMAYADIYLATLKNQNKFCLCGFMAAEQSSLPEKALRVLNEYFQFNLTWLEKVFTMGIKGGEFSNRLGPDALAALYVSSLEGGLLLARLQGLGIQLEKITQDFLVKIQA